MAIVADGRGARAPVGLSVRRIRGSAWARAALAYALLLWLGLPAVGWAADAGTERDRPAPLPGDPDRPAGGPLAVVVVRYHDAVHERDVFSQAVPQLLEYLGTATAVEARLVHQVQPLVAARLRHALLLYMTGQDARIRLDPSERQALGEYLRSGGMLFAEDVVSGGTPQVPPVGGGVAGTPFDQQLKSLIADPLVLGVEGRQWQRVPAGHPLYSAYFAFPDGPPLAGTYSGTVASLEMIERRGRIVVLFSDLNLSWFWANREAQARQRPLQLGVNIVVQALVQQQAIMAPAAGR